KDRNFQANHNRYKEKIQELSVVFDTTKIEIFKQITTESIYVSFLIELCLIPQR
ncbi:hypothetical protein HMPREF3218_0202363, partial [Prevotella bivia]